MYKTKISGKEYDLYKKIKDYIEKNNFSPSFREMLDMSNFKSVSSIKQKIDKLEKIGLIATSRNASGNLIARTIKILDTNETKNIIKDIERRLKDE